MVRIEVGFRNHDSCRTMEGLGATAEAAVDDACSGCADGASDETGEIELIRIEIDGLDLSGATQRAVQDALAVLDAFEDFSDASAMETAIRRYKAAHAASLDYQARQDAILTRCEALWGWPERDAGAEE